MAPFTSPVYRKSACPFVELPGGGACGMLSGENLPATRLYSGASAMPTLILENLPPEVYECLQRRAAQRQRSVPEETVQLLRQALQGDAASLRLPDLLPDEAIPAPCDLPMPGQGVQVSARHGDAPLPDAVGFPEE